ncbi:hypothetical protein M885DRAFT_530022 [Pelagophyceae sp. CCMP2097]|nr:hypothetical protein M885DRAFT_530022 [Pelagophyceae sp. CCMP2097]
MRFKVSRSRLQYDNAALWEPLYVEVDSPELTISDFKELISRRQREKSQGEVPRRAADESQVVVPPKDMVLVVRDFHDSNMIGVHLEDEKRLIDYGLIGSVEDNYFLRRVNPVKSAVADVLLLDSHHLTPQQRLRISESLGKGRDLRFHRHVQLLNPNPSTCPGYVDKTTR